MNVTDMDQRLEIIDRRLGRVEQILPTLATKADLEVLRLATQGDIEDAKQLTRVLFESTRHDIRLVAEGVASLTERLERKGII